MQKRAENARLRAVVIVLATAFFVFTARAQQANINQTLSGHVPAAITRLHLQPLSNFALTNNLDLAVNLPLRNQPALNNLLQQIYDPASPNYHHYLTPEQFTAQFGPTEQDYDTVVTFLRTNGLAVTTHSNRTLVDASGDAATINRAFQVTLRVYQHPTENRTFYAPDTDPVISTGVPISHITGLDNFVIPHPLSKIGYLGNGSSGQPEYGTGSGPVGQYLGKDFRAAYVPGVTLDGTGQTVGLFELDAYYQSDITNYEQLGGLPYLTVTPVAVNGGVGSPGTGDGEVSLDIETTISMATNLSQVLVYEAPNGNGNSIIDLLSTIADDDLAKQASSSWGIGDNSSYDTYYLQMAAQGQSFFQASGDDGAYYSGIGGWADDTNITLVGGTTLNTTGPVGSWSSESAWNWYIDLPGYTNSTGGGINFNNVPIPAYQLGISTNLNQGSATLRNVPDVALTADNVYVYFNDGDFQTNEFFGGTSCAAPLWAGFTALVNEQAANDGLPPVGFLNPAVYAIGKGTNYANCFHDITTGNNTNEVVGPGEWYAVPGYDLCTGWGTPNGQNLINALVPPSVGIIPLSGFSASGAIGGPFSPNSQAYTLTNSAASSGAWSLINTSTWLSVSSTSGILTGDSMTNVTIGLNAAADSLPNGTSSATILFTNSIRNIVSALQFTLSIGQNLVQNPGFETGSFPPWVLDGTTTIGRDLYNGVVDATSLSDHAATNFIHSGNYGAALGQDGDLAYLYQTLATVPGQNYLLSFWLNNPGGYTPNQFQVNWNTNSTTTNTVFNQVDMGAINNWTNMLFILPATGTNAVLEFGARNDNYFFGLDDVYVWPIPTPNVQSFSIVSSSGFSMTWYAQTGAVYQVQYSTNLASGNWFNLNTYPATNPVMTVTSPIGTNGYMFYRVIGLP